MTAKYLVHVQVPDELRAHWRAAFAAWGVLRIGDEVWSARLNLVAPPDEQGRAEGTLQMLAPEAPDLRWGERVELMAGDVVAATCTVNDHG